MISLFDTICGIYILIFFYINLLIIYLFGSFGVCVCFLFLFFLGGGRGGDFFDTVEGFLGFGMEYCFALVNFKSVCPLFLTHPYNN